MFQWWDSLQTMQQAFYLLAIPSTLILLIQTVLLLFGFGHDSDTDLDHDHDIGHDTHDGDGADHAAGIRLLSVRGIVAFFTVCGWAGVAMLDMGVNAAVTVGVSVLLGLGALVLVGVLLSLSMRMQQSGNMEMENAIGLTGEVYVPITLGGKGKVTLVVQERFMEMDAICPEAALKTGQRVKIVGVTESNTLIVSAI